MSQASITQAHDAIAQNVSPVLPFLPIPAIRDDAEPATAHYSFDIPTWNHILHVPADAGYPNFLPIHEQGHHFENRLSRWWPKGFPEVMRLLCVWHGLTNQAQIDAVVHDNLTSEIWAEHFTRAFAPGYDPAMGPYGALVGRVPFRSASDTRAFFASMVLEEYMTAKFISGDIAVTTDGKGDARVMVAVSNLRPGYDSYGGAQRIGLAGSETSLPNVTFSIDRDTAAYGWLTVKGDPVRNGVAYFRVCGLQ